MFYPVIGALHVIFAPMGCPACTWDLWGSPPSGLRLHRLGLATALDEQRFGQAGEGAVQAALTELICRYRPKAVFAYRAFGVALDDNDAAMLCMRVSSECGIPVLLLERPSVRGSRGNGYRAMWEVLCHSIGCRGIEGIPLRSINVLAEFNSAEEARAIRGYYRRMGMYVVATIPSECSVDDIARSHGASLNVVQSSDAMVHLARWMRKEDGIPFVIVDYFDINGVAKSLFAVAKHFGGAELRGVVTRMVHEEAASVLPKLDQYWWALSGMRVAVCVAATVDAICVVPILRSLGVKTVVVGFETGSRQDRKRLIAICDPDAVVVDARSAVELTRRVGDRTVDLLMGGARERRIASKVGVAFCDRDNLFSKPLVGFMGTERLAELVHAAVGSPIWGCSGAWRKRRRLPVVAIGAGAKGAHGALPVRPGESEIVDEAKDYVLASVTGKAPCSLSRPSPPSCGRGVRGTGADALVCDGVREDQSPR